MEAGEVEVVGGEVQGGRLAEEGVQLMLATWMRFWLLPSRVSLCEKCLLITESPKTPCHYSYLKWVLVYIPYTGLAVFSFAISRVPVYAAISNF